MRNALCDSARIGLIKFRDAAAVRCVAFDFVRRLLSLALVEFEQFLFVRRLTRMGAAQSN